MELSDLERQRYKKHLQLESIGVEGQLKLKHGRVLVIGAGGLGSPVLIYLAAAGVGNLSLLDDDLVTLSNLPRQVIHTTNKVGEPKVISAWERLEQMNPEISFDQSKRGCNPQTPNQSSAVIKWLWIAQTTWMRDC